MLKVKDWYSAVNQVAPFDTAFASDNVGLLVGSGEQQADTALLALDVTGEVLDEAVEMGIELIITHHPVIYHPLKRLDAASVPYRLARAGIAVISAHTNLDLARGGVNDALANALGLEGIRPLKTHSSLPSYKISVTVPAASSERLYQAMCRAGAGELGGYTHAAFLHAGEGRFRPGAGANPYLGTIGEVARVEEAKIEMLVPRHSLGAVLDAIKQAHPYEEPAFDLFETHAVKESLALGRVGTLAHPMEPGELALHAKRVLGAPGVRLAGGGGKVQVVAVCGGSGAGLLQEARKAGAGALVTGEAAHHEILLARELGMALVDAGHHATEAVVLAALAKELKALLPAGNTVLSTRCTDGVRFY